MPLIVDPSVPQVTPPAIITSPDGWLSAVVDEPWAGVLLGYNADTPPSARNLALNPSFTSNIANVGSFGANVTRTWSATGGNTGPGCLRVLHTGTTIAGGSFTIAPVTSGTVQVALWVKLPASGIVRGNLAWRSGTTSLRTQALTPATSGQWAKISGSHTLTAGQTCDNIGISFEPTAAGTEWFVDALMVEAADEPHPYVDGHQPGCQWEGTPDASTSVRITAAPDVADIRKVRITRQDPGAPAPVPVRSADPAWAIEGVGPAYDHEPPLGVTVIYTATPLYADGSAGPSSSLAVTMPEPGRPADVWIKSLDDPGLSARVTVISWPQLQWASRIDQGDIAGSPYPATSQDVYAAAASEITIDADGDEIEKLRKLLVTPGVRLIQTRPAAHRPDQFVLFANPGEAVDADPDGSRTFTAAVQEVGRPSTAAQPLRIPGWSYDALAAAYGTYDAVSATFPSYQQLATNGRLG
ncbi:hypothetical protein LZP81_30765 [Streptomyces parvulus]|uniref:hypothetical protein n=1 Tax=Streptomyces parvulus TaxID=146923 RepID=UPI001E545295|nr:hypothetical protein [Streptomyces parvulus]MCC9154912.1 hypothetical protein [Streptomyces parvulus]MCE7691243.1 hypothetical protein [Streptomyces parvulus]